MDRLLDEFPPEVRTGFASRLTDPQLFAEAMETYRKEEAYMQTGDRAGGYGPFQRLHIWGRGR
jgi:hypothetical protein